MVMVCTIFTNDTSSMALAIVASAFLVSTPTKSHTTVMLLTNRLKCQSHNHPLHSIKYQSKGLLLSGRHTKNEESIPLHHAFKYPPTGDGIGADTIPYDASIHRPLWDDSLFLLSLGPVVCGQKRMGLVFIVASIRGCWRSWSLGGVTVYWRPLRHSLKKKSLLSW